MRTAQWERRRSRRRPARRADEAGLRAGDVVTEAAGRPVAAVEDVLSVLRRSEPEDTLALTVMREAERRNITVKTDHRPR